jgi:expansin (peptidoglycan-binding protein)
MHPVPVRPVHGNWIWLVTAVLSATTLTGAALRYAAVACQAGPARAAGAAGTAAPVLLPGPPGAATSFAAPAATPAPAASGLAVFYNPGTVTGSCSLGPFPPGGLYVSLPPQRYAGSAACGTYLDVRGPRGRVRAEVVDLCPACAATSVNLDRAAFVQVAGPDVGSAPVSYRQVVDPVLPGPIALRVGTTAAGLLTLQVVNHGNRLTSVALASPGQAGAQWLALTRGPNDFWVSPAAPPAGPVGVRITDSAGHQVIVPGVKLTPGSMIRSRVWMYRTGGTASANPPGSAARTVTASGRPAIERRSAPPAAHC